MQTFHTTDGCDGVLPPFVEVGELPQDGCFAPPDAPDNRFKSTDPDDPDFGRLTE